MKKGLFVLAILLLVISPVLAYSSTLTIQGDELISGAVLRISSPGEEDWGEKIYPSLNGGSLGLVMFEIESSIDEVDFEVRFLNNGEVILKEIFESYSLIDSEILIDLREIASDVAEDIEINESEVVVEEIINDSQEGNSVELNETETLIEKETSENETIEQTRWTGFVSRIKGMTGFVVSVAKNNKNSPVVLIGIGAILSVLVLFFIVKKAYRSGALSELQSLGRMELDKKLDVLDKD